MYKLCVQKNLNKINLRVFLKKIKLLINYYWKFYKLIFYLIKSGNSWVFWNQVERII